MDGFSTERNNKGMKMKWYELARSRMKELGITQEKLAEELGMTQGGIGHWLRGSRHPSLDEIGVVFKYLVLITSHSTTTVHFHLLANTHLPPLKNNMSTLFFLMFRPGCSRLSLEPLPKVMRRDGSAQPKKPVIVRSGLKLKVIP